jgi:hypothetical protein
MSDKNHDTETEIFHLMRVRIHKKNFAQLKDIAKYETNRHGEHVCVSDLVRGAIHSFIQVHNTKERLDVVVNPKIKPKIRKG